MKKIILIYLAFTIFSCKPQNKEQETAEKIKHYKMENQYEYNKLVNKEFDKFDIKRFDKNKDQAEDYVYVLNDGTRFYEYGNAESGYFSEETPENSLYVISRGFYINSGIRAKGIKFGNVGCVLGIWYEFDENGKLIKETDYDKPFKIVINDIVQFLKINRADLYATTTTVNRFYDEKTKKGTWDLIYRGKYKDKRGMFSIEIDDSTSEITRVVKILGKEGEKEILFEK
jgi:hypothetical protein